MVFASEVYGEHFSAYVFSWWGPADWIYGDKIVSPCWIPHGLNIVSWNGLNSIYKLSLIQIFHSISMISQIFFHMFSLTGTDARIGCNDFCFLWALLETILLILLCILLVGASRSCRRAEKS